MTRKAVVIDQLHLADFYAVRATASQKSSKVLGVVTGDFSGTQDGYVFLQHDLERIDCDNKRKHPDLSPIRRQFSELRTMLKAHHCLELLKR